MAQLSPQAARTRASMGTVWLVYTLAFAALVVALGLAERFGIISPTAVGYIFLAVTVGVYAAIGIYSRTAQLDEYYVAGRQIPSIFNGMATASDWLSGASFVSLAGVLYLSGYNGLAYVMGWTGGYVLLGTLIAPYLRKYGKYTIPDFIGDRYGGNLARTVAILATVVISFTYLVGQISSVAIIAGRLLGLPLQFGVFVGLGGILFCSFLGGMRAITWTQVAQYIILIIAYLVPVTLISQHFTGVPIPQVMYGRALEAITALEAQYGVTPSYVEPFTQSNALQFLALTLCLMCGTAGLPHVLVRFYTVPSVRDARWSVGWAIFFIGLLYLTVPAYAAFARWEVLANVVGQPIASLPGWVEAWSRVGLVSINDLNGDGILQYAELTLNGDVIVLATPEIAELPYVVAGLVAAGGLAAALSTADGLLIAVSAAVSHDFYYRMINPNASAAQRLFLTRVMLLVVAAVGAYVASFQLALIAQIVGWAFTLAASSIFPALVLGLWWKRSNAAGCVAGILSGLAVTITYLIANRFFGIQILGIEHTAAGIFGMPVNFLVNWLVSRATPAPSREIQEMVEELRYPKRLAAAEASQD